MAKILIIDDNLIMRRNLRIMLEKIGHKVVGELEDGRQVVNKYKECERPDIVTMDITMPIIDGIEALKNLKASYPMAKVVMISAVGQKSKVLKAMHLGAEHYIIKPIREDKLEEIITKVLKKEASDVKKQEECIKDIKQIEKKLGIELEKIDRTSSLDVINENGEFIIKIKGNLNNELLDMVNKTINGFLVIKPLKIRFQIKKKHISESYKEDFEKLIKKISIVGGKSVIEYV